jgi:hypothetical protein
VELEGTGLALSAVKESEDGRFLVLRCVNLTDHSVAGRWRLGQPVRAAHLGRLDERRVKKVPVVRGHEVPFNAPPGAVVTVLVR